MTTDKNTLYYGDNYEVLQRYIKDESVDLVYLEPPFNSRQDYNVLFAETAHRYRTGPPQGALIESAIS